MSDARFSRLKSDPRFRNPRRKTAKVVVDERFKDVSRKEKETGRVDKYGRPLSRAHERDKLRRFYRLGNEEDIPLADQATPDLARGEALLESSDEEDVSEASLEESDFGDTILIGHDPSRPIPVTQTDAEIDLDETILAELDSQASAYTASHPNENRDGGTATSRIAVVNLDWDHVRASHLYKIFSSVLSPATPADSSVPAIFTAKHTHPGHAKSGGVLNIRVYTSEFGKQRLAWEEEHGPPPGIFKEKNLLQEEINGESIYEVGQEGDCDEDALRRYQLERLRYYYAIVTCDSVETASYIYNELEGTELERSANVFDLSFVPEDMTFDGDIRDGATENPDTNYRGLDFVTDALRHSKVKLTWDEDDPERNQITRRTLSRKEIEDADFRIYLASSASESENDDDQREARKISREKLRATLLGSNDHEMPEGWGDQNDNGSDVDMEITFTPGLGEKHDPDETTLDKYQRKRREKRKKRKSELITREIGHSDEDFFEQTDGVKSLNTNTSLPTQKQLTTPEELSLLAAGNIRKDPQHFDFKSIIKADRQSKRKGKGRPKPLHEEDNEIQEDFSINVNDNRFKALHEDHNYAIDPSHPQFKKTKGMSALLEERSKRQKTVRTGNPITAPPKKKESGGDLKTLVESVKRKSAIGDQKPGKRRKQGSS